MRQPEMIQKSFQLQRFGPVVPRADIKASVEFRKSGEMPSSLVFVHLENFMGRSGVAVSIFIHSKLVTNDRGRNMATKMVRTKLRRLLLNSKCSRTVFRRLTISFPALESSVSKNARSVRMRAMRLHIDSPPSQSGSLACFASIQRTSDCKTSRPCRTP